MARQARRTASDSRKRLSLWLEPLEPRLLLSGTGVPIYCSATGHFYELVAAQGFSWQKAETAAEALSYLGVQGHLATITSQAESDFVTDQIVPLATSRTWIGAYKSPDSPNPDVNWHWVTGETWSFTNWDTGEPNNNGSYGQEDWVDLLPSSGGRWNDESAIPDAGFYLAEFDTVLPAPVNTVPGAQTTAENTSLAFSAANGNAISIADANVGSNPVQVTLTGTDGVLTLSGETGLTFTTGEGTADPAMVFTGTIADINTALNGLIFTTPQNYNGSAGVQISTDDLGDNIAGVPLTTSNSVGVAVTPVNQKPVAQSQSTNIDANAQAVLTLGATDVETPYADLTFNVPAQTADGGSLTALSQGQYLYVAPAGKILPDSFQFTVTDNGNPAGSHANPGDLTSDPAQVSIGVGSWVSQHVNHGQSLQFLDANSDLVTLSLSGKVGSGTVYFPESGKSDIGRIVLDGTDATSSLTISTKVKGLKTAVNEIDVNGSLNSLTAGTTDLLGDLTVTGSLKSLQLGDVTGPNTITVGDPTTPKDTLSLKLGMVSDLSINSAIPIKSLAATGWLNTDGMPDVISAPSLGTVTIKGGDFQAEADIGAGGIGSIAVQGGDFSGSLLALGPVGTISVASLKDSATGAYVGGSITDGAVITVNGADPKKDVSLTRLSATGSIAGLDMTLAGGLGSLSAAGLSGGSLDAGAVGAVTLSGDFASQMNVGSLASLTIKGGNFSGALVSQNPVGLISVSGQKNKTTGANVGGSITSGAAITVHGADPKKNLSLTTLSATGTITGADLTLAAGLGSLTAARWDGGSLAAGFMSSLAIKGDIKAGVWGDLANVQMNLTGEDAKGYSLGSASIAGKIDDSVVTLTHSGKSFTVGSWGAGSILAVAVNPGTGGYFNGGATGAGGRLDSLVIQSGYDTVNGGVGFGVITDGFGKMVLDGVTYSVGQLPFNDGDCHIWLA